MKIKQAKYISSSVDFIYYPEYILPEIAFLGRSNVGKSSLINLLTNNNKLSKTSKSPGKTKTINFFLINNLFYFVDLPGYGYANLSKKQSNLLKIMIEGYLKKRNTLIGVIMLLDIRHMPSREDLLIFKFLENLKISIIFVFTKCDKISKMKKNIQLKKITEKLNLKNHPILTSSTINTNNIYLILKQINILLKEKNKRRK